MICSDLLNSSEKLEVITTEKAKAVLNSFSLWNFSLKAAIFCCFDVFSIWPLPKFQVQAKILATQPVFPDYRSVSYDYGFLEKHQFGEESIHSFTLTHQRAIFLLNFALDILYFCWGEFLNINHNHIFIKLSKSKYLSASLTVQKQSFADFFKTGVLKNFIIFTEKHLCRSVFSGL